MAWLLYELSHHPDVQAKVREEIAMAKYKAPGALTSNDYDAMAWLNAVIKVWHRFMIFRAMIDDDWAITGSSPVPSACVWPLS